MDRVLIADEDRALCHFLVKAFTERGYQAIPCHSGEDGLNLLREKKPGLILLENKLPDRNGLEILKEIKRDYPKVIVIMMAALRTTETAIEAMRLGAFNYIVKPFELDEIFAALAKGLEAHHLMSRAVAVPSLAEYAADSDQMIGKSRVMQEVYKIIGQVAGNDVTVLIRGESGTGKELVARAIYHYGRRKDRPFLAINCAAIPETLLESELFGHEKGAFTGATKRRIGKFEQCDRGTILLDEIGDMSLATQAKILRVLQEGEFERVGGNETIQADVRVLTSTNRNLEDLINQGKFRADLYYRLKIMSITLPPLRERKDDIRELTEYFVHLHNEQSSAKISYIHPSVFSKLASFHWPGNVRELANTLKRSLILCKGNVMTASDVIFDVESDVPSPASEEELEHTLERMLDPLFNGIFKSREEGLHANLLERVEKLLVQKALSEMKGNQVQSAKLLGVSRNTLRNRIRRYGLS
jgi:two-component system, NtrC family, response regulator AtoC